MIDVLLVLFVVFLLIQQTRRVMLVERPVKLLFVQAAPGRSYGEVIDAVDVARGAGVQVVGFAPWAGER